MSTPRFPRALIDQLFELGVMGIEVPESYGGAGASFFHSVLAVEALSRVDPSIGVLVDVQNTLVINALLRWGNDDDQAALAAEAGGVDSRRVLPVRSRLGQRRVRAADARDRGARKATSSTAASCGSPTATKPTSSSSSPISIRRPAIAASPPFSSSAGRRVSPSARKRTSSASAPAAPASCSSRTASSVATACSARWARATRSPSKRSTRAGLALARR